MQRKFIKVPDGFSQGYVCGCKNQLFNYEYRIIASKIIGRELKKEEIVHHIDFNEQNNDISNLMVFRQNKDHSKFHQMNCDMNILEKDNQNVYHVKEQYILP